MQEFVPIIRDDVQQVIGLITGIMAHNYTTLQCDY